MTNKRMSRSAAKKPAAGTTAGAGLLVTVPLAIAGGWIAYSALRIDHQVPLTSAIGAEWLIFYGQTTGRLSAYVDRSAAGRPLVLIHSVNAAASSYEMRPIFDHYRSRRPVYALDLPGFGFSDRTERVYSPQLYQDAILDLLTSQVGEPADVIALSLGCEFAARAALARPDLFHSLALISPSGFNQRDTVRSSQLASQRGSSEAVYRLLSFPLWGRAVYDLIATRRSIEFFLKQSFVGPIAPGLVDYDYATAHQPGAHYAPLYFVSGQLFTREVRQEVYERLTVPVLVIYDRDAFSRFDTLPEVVEGHAHWHAMRISPTLGLPHFERLTDTAQALDAFWNDLG
jgi:pimeloyl-ACP methyl ester carboxylesterase